nr:uncharacterized protein KIAA2026 [Nothobranchius furzeri]
MTDRVGADCSQKWPLKQDRTALDRISAPQQSTSRIMSSKSKRASNSSDNPSEDRLSNGSCEAEALLGLRCSEDREHFTAGDEHLTLSNDLVSEFPDSDSLLPEVCISSNRDSFEDDMNYEVQQAYKIFTSFLSDKHKGITGSFLHPIGRHETRHGDGEHQGRVQSQLRQSMCLKRIEEKFISQEYETITEFVADFRLMLENCYRYYGVDHWISKQAQKLETMMEQKLTLLSRTLREKTTLAMTSKGRFGAEEERGSGGTSTRKRQASRYFATATVGGHESVMVQTLRLEEQQRAKEEKRQRELEKKEAEEMSAKEVEDWEQGLLSQASPHTVDTVWELPAVGHFLCLAQTALNLPEIVFFELERCLLMPRCSLLLSKIMSSLLSPPQRRATLHRRPALPYRRWESELRQRILGWYRAIGASRDQPRRAEQLGLCHQFFSILGEASPLEEKPFHLLPFYQRVWLLKGLCDHVYETQRDVQDAVLAQPIHECRESILGYDGKENAYIHFPHFCGADLRIYCQSPSTPPAFPFPSVLVKRVETEAGTEGEESDVIKSEEDGNDEAQINSEECDFVKRTTETLIKNLEGNSQEDKHRFQLWSPSELRSSNGHSCDNSKLGAKQNANSLVVTKSKLFGECDVKMKDEISVVGQQSKQERVFSLASERTFKAETEDPCLNVGEHSYMGRSPASSASLGSLAQLLGVKSEEVSPSQGHQMSPCLECCKNTASDAKSAGDIYCCSMSRLATPLSSESTQNSSEERVNDKSWTNKKKRKKKWAGEQLVGVKRERGHLLLHEETRLSQTEAAKSSAQKSATTIKRKEKKRKHKTEKKAESLKKAKEAAPPFPSFKLVCSSLDELRELISKIEDELDELESMKKRLGRWYYKKEAVKELHSTLIRLLNELLPWEPKLVKACQRNRLRLKKEFDDFKKHPEYNSFVREECVSSSSSSSSDYDYEERDLEKDCCVELENDQEHAVPRGLWIGANTTEFVAKSAAEETCEPANHPKHPLTIKEKGVCTTTAESRRELKLEPIQMNQSKDPAWTPGLPAHLSLSPKYPILNLTGGLPKGYTPIPTLLAKSVGNKVTLMKRPADLSSSADEQRKGSLVSTSTVANPKIVKAQSFPSVYQQSLQEMTAQSPQQTQVLEQLSTKAAALPKPPQAKTSQSEQKSPVQVVYKAPEGFGHLVRKDNSNPVKMSVHSVLDQKTAEKVMQQVVFLPSNLLVKQTETKKPILNPKQSKGIQVTVSTVASPVCISTDVPGFSIPESNVTVQHVDTLKDAKPGKNLGPFFPLPLQKGTLNTVGYNETQVCNVQTTTPKGSVPTTSPVTTLPKVSADTVKLAEPKQELKTMCIRGSQSILVTTRGGNTGIVKVQTSSDHNTLGLFPTSPIITISPQLKAFLVSKALPTFSASAISQTPPSSASTVTSISTAQKYSPNPTNSTPTTLTGRIPLTGQDSQTTSANVALSPGPKISNCLMAETEISKLVPTSTSASSFPASRFNNSAPSLSSCGVSQVLTQEFIKKAGAKRPSADESPQATKRFLVTPSSSMTPNEATSKNTPSSPKSFSSSKVVLISQPSVTSTATFMGNLPKQVMATGSGQSMISSVSSQTLTTKSSTNASSSPEASPKANNMTMPSSIAFSLGKTTSIGQTIGALSHCSSTTTPVSELGTSFSTAAITTGQVSFTTSATRCSSQLGTCSSLPTSSPLQGVAAISGISQVSCTSSTGPGLLKGNLNQNDPCILTSISPRSSPVQVTNSAGGSPAQTWTSVLHPKPHFFKSTLHEEHVALPPSSQLAHNKTQTTLSFAPSTCASFPTLTTGTVQQKIIINTSTHLTAGTQIFLNNARFVVPPQGLGPGSHVLIISSPEPQVPTATHTITGPSVALKGQSPTNFTPLAPVLPQTSAKLPLVPAVSSSLVACTPALLPSAPHVTPFRLGASGLGSTQITSKTHAVSALPRFPSVHAGNFGSPSVCTSTLASSPPRLGSVPAVVSPVTTSAPALGSSLATIGIPAATITQTTSSSTIAPISTPLPKLSGALSSLPVFPSLSAGAFSSPVIPVSSPLCSVSAQTVTDAPCLPGQEMAGLMSLGPTTQPEQTGVRFAAPSTVHPQSLVQTGLGNSLIKNHLPVLQPVLSGTKTQILPPMSVPTIVNTVTRMKQLPVATVPPVGSTVSTFEMAPANMAAPASTAVLVSPVQPITSMASRNAIQRPVIPANKALRKDSVQISALGTHTSVPSKLLVSPDGAVLSTVQCRVNPANLNASPKPLDALVVSSNSSIGALQTHDSSLHPLRADTSEPTEQH